MPNKNVASLAIGRLAGKNAGVPPEKIGRLSIVSYLMGNPVLAIVAARSMAPKGDEEPVANGNEKPNAAPATAEEVKVLVDAAKVAAAGAGASEANAKASADAAKASADKAEAAAAKLGKN